MKALGFWFDPVSPYAYLAFERLPEALAGLSYSVSYRPILFASARTDAGDIWSMGPDGQDGTADDIGNWET